MTTSYEPLTTSRISIRDYGAGIEAIIRPRRVVLMVAFVAFWLCGWTVAGVKTIAKVVERPEPFLLFWLGGWAIGWVSAATTVAWFVFGREIIGTSNKDLFIRYDLGGIRRTKTYRGSEIRDFVVNSQSLRPWTERGSLPFIVPLKTGGVSFTYGARTIYAGADLDPAEARLVVAALTPRLPKTAETTAALAQHTSEHH